MKHKGHQRGQKPYDSSKQAPIFYEDPTLSEQHVERNRRTKRLKSTQKHGELGKNKNYRSDWQDEE